MIDSKIAESAYARFQKELKDLTYRDGEKHVSKACLVCDRLLEWNDNGILQTSRLAALSPRFKGETSLFTSSVHQVLKSHYTYEGPGRKPWMEGMYLSPRGCFQVDKEGFQCCKICTAALNTKVKPCRVR